MFPDNPIFAKRRAGILLHPTSLPETPGNGDLGHQARYFIDFLVSCGATVWQMLPLGPVNEDLSPYQTQSVHAANPLLISLDLLAKEGWLSPDNNPPTAPEAEVRQYRYHRLRQAYEGFQRQASTDIRQAYTKFIADNAYWLPDYALFRTLTVENNEAPWLDWQAPYRDRQPQALEKIRSQLAREIDQYQFEQFIFYQQWQDLKQYAKEKQIYLFGDIPIFVALNSADVWANQHNFLLDETGQPKFVTGVPPDYFSATGQLWGNPHYDWQYMQNNGFQWWIERLRTQEKLFDMIRVDHFRGFEACWKVDAKAKSAINGEWVKIPGEALFNTLQNHITLPLVAEDLGVITDEVIALRDKFGLPGMRVLQFAFDRNPHNIHLPHNYIPHSVVYTGTHDNNTTLGWFQNLSPEEQQYICDYTHSTHDKMPWGLMETALASVSQLAVVPMQDVLAADAKHRMNQPGVAEGNWRWRFEWSQLPENSHLWFKERAHFYGRS